jgi:4-hydroxysphinganine ceramide fatty acyl 2-hydroxylase
MDATTFASHHPGGAGLILNYQSKDVSEQMKGHHPLSLKMADSLIIGGFKKEISKYINPDKPLMDQVWDMDHETYLKIVESPHWLFVPSPRMFESDFNEWFSHNKWQRIFILPFLLVLYWIYTVDFTTASPLRLFITFLCGVFTFSLVEYLLHRFVFHCEKWLPNNKICRYLHYTLHGIHHTLPNDPDRLVYPPILFTITYIILNTFIYGPLKPDN